MDFHVYTVASRYYRKEKYTGLVIKDGNTKLYHADKRHHALIRFLRTDIAAIEKDIADYCESWNRCKEKAPDGMKDIWKKMEQLHPLLIDFRYEIIMKLLHDYANNHLFYQLKELKVYAVFENDKIREAYFNLLKPVFECEGAKMQTYIRQERNYGDDNGFETLELEKKIKEECGCYLGKTKRTKTTLQSLADIQKDIVSAIDRVNYNPASVGRKRIMLYVGIFRNQCHLVKKISPLKNRFQSHASRFFFLPKK